MNYGFIKACAVSPALRVADCPYNAQKTIEAMQQAAEDGCQLTVFPELGLTGYTCGDLFLQQPLLDAAEAALREILKASEALQLVALVGLPVTVDAKLYNCAAVICQGALLGLVPKSHIPNYGEFYEKRHYCAAPAGVKEISFAGQKTLFGTKLLFRCETMQAFTLAVEICEDLWAPLPPSTAHALSGATVIANLSASDETVGKAEYRRALVSQQSARLLCAYLYADAGHGESTTDMVFSGHNLIAENGVLLAESRPFSQALACTELDLGRLLAERRRNTSFEPVTDGYETVSFHLPLREIPLTRYISPTPFVPADGGARAERCELILQMQADGLAKRIEHAHAKTAVIAFDSDNAGQKATNKAISYLRTLGVSVRVLQMQGAKDPDEYIKTYGRERFSMLISRSKTPTEYQLDKLKETHDLTDIAQKTEYSDKGSDVIARLPSKIEREIYAGILAKELNISVETVMADIERRRRNFEKAEQRRTVSDE